MSGSMNDPNASQPAANMAKETVPQKIQEPGKTIPSSAYQPIPAKDLGIKVRIQPDNEDDIDIESVPIYYPLVSIIELTENPKFQHLGCAWHWH